MKYSALFSVFLLFGAIYLPKAQFLDQTAIGVGYKYTGRNSLKLSFEYRTSTSSNQPYFNLGAGAIYTPVNGSNKILPEIHAYYNTAIFMYGVSASPYAIEPNIGLSLFNAIWLTGGYALPLNKEKYFHGVTVGIQFNIAPVKASDFYDKFRTF
ncbi:hypothetical protein [Elizabethkingia bruuniana]|uniref:Outer membrane protein beta-barrel domain-containing protein n=1 Tax=Elizabethkingia bruuniana TaxID=1756149 RepID=A0A7T7UXA4_9FLAO|nr:hypothetical protein [Elizabethkingia bruuniana]KGO09784.1 hypothetical protein KS04_12920 [Elizabethkingia miricola]AQX84476.1 hypothetical protein AYC65_05325 [Elizabethkingia bruuniana]KUY27930.1 hypothetical protein ATB97_17320 [Elizabethkingia bruuniana]OPB64891.1 hypothetical protein BAY12_08965 [Elizabethkingia bruuniana]QDZ62940.1 hypothetical protein EVD20_10000 [Elizabethkingia bruuniana]